jgi:nucleotide-binding universal stress UspA family protein
MFPLRTILHPTNFSEESDHALRIACQLARDYQARLVLLHAVEPPLYSGEVGTGQDFHAPEKVRERALERIAHLVEPGPGVAVEPVVVEGFKVDEILREARERHCDLIVIGSHGRTGISRMLLGSTAEEVERKACCPVLIVRKCHETAVGTPEGTEAGAKVT